MRLLVLGGTSFVGRAIVEQALERGHELTLFSRGQTGADLFPDVERRTGDRAAGDYASLKGGSWDAVIDVSGYVPRHITQATDALDGAIGRYLFISTISVYDETDDGGEPDEDAPRLAPERGTEEITGDTYGPLKVACEDELSTRWKEQATIVRPGIVAGPWDPTDRFTYWVRRAARGGRVALTGRSDQPTQVVDSRDLARLVVSLVEGDVAGTYNAVGPEGAVTLADLIGVCATAAGREVQVVEVPAAGGSPGLPLVLDDPKHDVLFRRSAVRARTVGLTATPLVTTAADVLAWDSERGVPPLKVGPTEVEEAALLGQA
jgi:2'-hydroxyisoflavone reductase